LAFLEIQKAPTDVTPKALQRLLTGDCHRAVVDFPTPVHSKASVDAGDNAQPQQQILDFPCQPA
jgi:hypothetical protein